MAARDFLRKSLIRLFAIVVLWTGIRTSDVAFSMGKELGWGKVTTVGRTANEARITFRIHEPSILSYDLVGGAPVAQGTSVSSTPEIPSYSFLWAVPPGASLSAEVIASHTRLTDTQRRFIVGGFVQATDSSSLIPISRSISDIPTGVFPTIPARVEGYEWYRGRRLARVRIFPYTRQGTEVRFVEEVEIKLRTNGTAQDTQAMSSSSDPHFDRVWESLVLNSDQLPEIPVSRLTWTDTTGLWLTYGKPFLRLAIPSDGIYRLTFEQLQLVVPSIGQVDPRTFRLINYGREIALYVDGEADSSFSPGEYLEFVGLRNYGRGNYRSLPAPEQEYPQFMDRYTDTSYYWLTWGGEKGLRVATNDGIAATTDTLKWYTHFLHLERDNFLQFVGGDLVIHQDPRWLSGDFWAWDWLIVASSTSTFNVSFSANQIFTGYPTTRVWARLASWGAQNVFPAHKLRLRVNSSDTLQYADVGQYQHIMMYGEVPVSTLINGTNNVRVHSIPTASSVNQMLFDWADVEYPRNLVVLSDTLRFAFRDVGTTAVRVIRITGLTTQNVRIHKFRPLAKLITNLSVSGTSTFTVSFADTVSPGDEYIIVTVPKLKTPSIQVNKTFVNLRDPSRRADYVLITTDRFSNIANSYVSFIQTTYGVQAAVINVRDVFDEFGYGYPRPESIREFLKATTRWRPPMPAFVMLVGDGTYDHKFIMADPNPANRPLNAIPPWGAPVSDPYFAVLDDSSITPQMYVGRLAVNTETEFLRYFGRLQSYVAAGNDDWNKKYLFFAGGDPNIPGQVELFRSVNDYIINQMVKPPPIGGVATHFYKTKNPQSDFGPYSPEEIREALDDGGVFINYIGHSGTQTWDNSIGEPSQLQNKRGRLALISDFGCSTAKFAEPNIKSFGELFTVGETGSAIAYVGNSALGFISIATSLPITFYRNFLEGQVLTVGQAHLQAKIERMNQTGGPTSINRVMMLTNTLLGDPIVQLAIPQKPNLSFRPQSVGTVPPFPSDEDHALTLLLPYVNTGRVVADTFFVAIQENYLGTFADTIVARPLPLFKDTIRVTIPIYDRPGQHTFQVELNPDNRIDEIERSLNSGSFQIVVSSSALKPISPIVGLEQRITHFTFLNPVRPSGGATERIVLELDTTASFSTKLSFVQPFGNVTTTFAVPPLTENKQYYWRANLEHSTRPASQGTFVYSSQPGVWWRDGANGFQNSSLTQTKYDSGVGVRIAEDIKHVRVTSSGFYDGAFGAVEINGANVLPNTFSRGHSVVVFDSLDLSIQDIRVFDTWGSAAFAESLRVYVNSLVPGSIVAELVIDEGAQNLTASVRTAIKTLGSKLIDSLKLHDSWAIIGRKGATPGTVMEGWKRKFSGRVIIDTTFVRPGVRGTIASQEIGPAGRWHSVSLSRTLPPGSSIVTTVLGMMKDGSVDTLVVDDSSAVIMLSSVDAKKYPRLRLVATLQANDSGISPTLKEWGVSFSLPPELAVNYQSVSASADSVLEGDPVGLRIRVHNVGYDTASAFRVSLTALSASGPIALDTMTVAAIPPDESVLVSNNFATQGRRGNNSILVSVDPDERITELYKTNNFYSFPIFVKTDTIRPSLDVTFDGVRIFDGDYVSAQPTIQALLYDNSPLPINDPSKVVLRLNNRKINLGATPDSLFEPRPGPEKALVVFRPTLPRGEHTLSLQVYDATGNPVDTAARQFRFRVETQSRLLNVLNFPNPFSDETHFTFNLVGAKLPDELFIKIYTVSGRLIQELRVPRSELRFGFNRVRWDGRDRDGDALANGVYLYKIVMNIDGRSEEIIQKLAKVR